MRAILIDDEPDSTHVLQTLLKRNCPDVEVVAACNDSEEGLEKIKSMKPDIVFLDIEMPIMNGFQLLESLPTLDFMLIFTTAYDQYAVRAFKYSALDYLMKPIDPAELRKTVQKASEKSNYDLRQIEILKQQLSEKQQPQPRRLPGRVALPNQHGLVFVEIGHITYIESEGSYSKVHLHTGHHHLVAKPIGEVEETLQDAQFFRTHRQYLINLDYVREYIRSDGGSVVMQDGTSIPITRTRKEEFVLLFSRV